MGNVAMTSSSGGPPGLAGVNVRSGRNTPLTCTVGFGSKELVTKSPCACRMVSMAPRSFGSDCSVSAIACSSVSEHSATGASAGGRHLLDSAPRAVGGKGAGATTGSAIAAPSLGT